MQIDLNTGVANGVLVCRKPGICAELIFRVLTNSLEFEIISAGQNKRNQPEIDSLNHRLVERKTRCTFRVVTKDEMLTNSFWNVYKRGEH
jgi:hypothetical protein